MKSYSVHLPGSTKQKQLAISLLQFPEYNWITNQHPLSQAHRTMLTSINPSVLVHIQKAKKESRPTEWVSACTHLALRFHSGPDPGVRGSSHGQARMHVQACQEISDTSDQNAKRDVLFVAVFLLTCCTSSESLQPQSDLRRPHKYHRTLTKSEVQRPKPPRVGSRAVFPKPVSARTTFSPTFWATLRGWQLLTKKKKKKVHSGGGKRIIFKKEHNLTFLSTTHSTPPPHSLVSPPACSSISFFFPSLSLPVAPCTTLSHTFSSPCPQLGHQLWRHTGNSSCAGTWSCCQALEGVTKLASFLLNAPNV